MLLMESYILLILEHFHDPPPPNKSCFHQESPCPSLSLPLSNPAFTFCLQIHLRGLRTPAGG